MVVAPLARVLLVLTSLASRSMIGLTTQRKWAFECSGERAGNAQGTSEQEQTWHLLAVKAPAATLLER